MKKSRYAFAEQFNNKTYFRPHRYRSILSIFIFSNNSKRLLIIDKRPSEDKEKGKECYFQMGMATISSLFLSFHTRIDKQKNTATELRIKVIVAICHLNQHKRLTTDYVGNDMDQECKLFYNIIYLFGFYSQC